MGKGDKKTGRGKIFMGSYGVTRRRKKKRASVPKVFGLKKTLTPDIVVPKEAVAVVKEAVKETVTKKTRAKSVAEKSPAIKKTKAKKTVPPAPKSRKSKAKGAATK